MHEKLTRSAGHVVVLGNRKVVLPNTAMKTQPMQASCAAAGLAAIDHSALVRALEAWRTARWPAAAVADANPRSEIQSLTSPPARSH